MNSNTNVVPVDFRVRVAKQKRERMRQRIKVAAIDIFSTASTVKPPVIDDIIKTADISRGTFYKYYDSLEKLLSEIGKQTASDVLHVYKSMLPLFKDSQAKLLAGPILSMLHAGMEPAKALMTTRIDLVEYFSQENNLEKIIVDALHENSSKQNIHYESLEAATDFVVGATLEAVSRIARKKVVLESYVKCMTLMIASGLNMNRDQAKIALDLSWNTIVDNTGNLPWWRPELLLTETKK